MKIEIHHQSELDLILPTAVPVNVHGGLSRNRRRRRSRAALWFNHMRQLVNGARDWPDGKDAWNEIPIHRDRVPN